MATLVSPGSLITVTDESNYSSSGQGSIPLIIIGTHQYKALPDGSGVAEGTLPENANRLYPITSQRELIQTFGNPIFYTKNGTSVHGYELNEFGLHAAYNVLGISNRAFVIRADIDYAALVPTTSEPRSEPKNGTHWLDTVNNTWGFYEYTGSQWTTRDMFVIEQLDDLDSTLSEQVPGQYSPLSTLGEIGDLALVVVYEDKSLYQKLGTDAAPTSGEWLLVGSDEWKAAKVLAGHVNASLKYNTYMLPDEEANAGDILVLTTMPGRDPASANSAKWLLKTYDSTSASWVETALPIYDRSAEATLPKQRGSVYVGYDSTQAVFEIRYCDGNVWQPLFYDSGSEAPSLPPAEGTLWYNPDDLQVSIKVSQGGQWVPYRSVYPQTDPNGVILLGSAPSLQTTGDPLVDNDLWIDTSDLENYPKMYKRENGRWKLIDIENNIDPVDGIAFGEIGNTNALNYPEGMKLFDLSASTNDVKQYQGGVWTNVSGYQINGVPYFGRKAQRQMIVRAMAETLVSNEDIRAETVFYNLVAAPGYVELIDEMVSLNNSIKNVAFVVGDTPARLKPTGTSIQNFVQPSETGGASNTESALTTFDPYVGVYYPWGLSTNLNGNEVMVPPSTIALHTIIQSDNISAPWLAPAGLTRGLVDGFVTSVGYLAEDGEYKALFLNQGQRDLLYTNKINPIAYMPNRGLIVYGQKTRHNLDTALDRINVARLINYLRYNLDNLSKAYLFEPNDFHTRDSIRTAFERFLGNIVTLRGLYDYVVVCDESNNTPERIARNELWVDIAIQPVQAVEFIYIPIRIAHNEENL